MEDLLLWLDKRFETLDMHPVMVTATFIYEFFINTSLSRMAMEDCQDF